MSFLWGAEVIIREQYAENMSKLWTDYPNHPMSFLHKLYFIIQLSYYLHMLPELYFQKIKKDEQPAKIQHSIAGTAIIGFFYFFAYRRIAIVLLTLHYFSEFVAHTFGLLEVFDKDEKYIKCEFSRFNRIPNRNLTNFRFSPRLQQHHLLVDRLLYPRSLVPDLLHWNRQDSLDPWHDGTRSRILDPRLLNLPFHRLFPQIETRIQGTVVKVEEIQSRRRRTSQERTQEGVRFTRGRSEHKREPKES